MIRVHAKVDLTIGALLWLFSDLKIIPPGREKHLKKHITDQELRFLQIFCHHLLTHFCFSFPMKMGSRGQSHLVRWNIVIRSWC